MSNAQSTLTISSEIKKRAEKRARTYAMSVSAIACILLDDYAAGRINVGVRLGECDEDIFTPEKAAAFKKTLAGIKGKKNLSPEFESANEAIAWLKK